MVSQGRVSPPARVTLPLFFCSQGFSGKELADVLQPWVVPGTGKVDWSNAEACAAVTTVLLSKDWGLGGWRLPKGYLVGHLSTSPWPFPRWAQ